MMKCGDCKLDMIDITKKFDQTESHLLGPGWTHHVCPKCGGGKHIMAGKLKVIPGNKLPGEIEKKLIELKNTHDEIDMTTDYINTLFEDENLQKLMEKQKKLQEKIDNKVKELGIATIEETLREQMANEKELLDTIGSSIDDSYWGPDVFTKGKKDAVASNDGTIVVLRSTRTDRKIIPSKFVETYPLLANIYVAENRIKITLKEAEKDIGKDDLDKVTEKKVTHSFELNIKDGRNLPAP